MLSLTRHGLTRWSRNGCAARYPLILLAGAMAAIYLPLLPPPGTGALRAPRPTGGRCSPTRS